ncbi:MAG: insulinase family protein, partial [Oscillospiraceae bacterium]|nr:insulinase family protein [Oscillospiraceae bacterium]
MYEKLTLPNGVRILTEHIPYVRSAALGIWVGSGSRFERASENGASHFIEHMVFKGTATRSASDLAEEMDAVGGQTNAFTTKECTVFYGRALDTHLDRLSDVLTDMFFNSKFDEADVINERGVIFEEIGMYSDAPDDVAAERLFTSCFKGSGLARPILGTKATLNKMTGESLRAYAASHYIPQRVVIALAGSFSDSDVKSLCERFSVMQPGAPLRMTKAEYRPAITVKRKAIEQNHLCLGFPGLKMTDDRRYALGLMSSILGGGMSSRLFQTVRERSGLCYSIYSFSSNYSDAGLFSIYTALNRESEEKALRLIMNELDRICQHGVTPDELD